MHKAVRFLAIALAILAVVGCGNRIVDKKYVKIAYTGTLADGTKFDSSEDSQPLEFMIGAGQMLAKFEENLMGLRKGDKKTFTILAADAYGERDETLMEEVPLSAFPKDLTLTTGMQLGTTDPTTGQQMIVTVAELKKDVAVIDFNSPLAGKDLTFSIEVMEVRNATKEELSALQESTSSETTSSEPVAQ
jgi:peptidylprolyl isomerase